MREEKKCACADAEWKAHPLKSIVASHRAPSFAVNPHNGDLYSAYNKPAAVIDWLQHVDVRLPIELESYVHDLLSNPSEQRS